MIKKKNHISCYIMAVGEMFHLIARATADTVNGGDQREIFKQIAADLTKSVKAVRYYAEMYFETSVLDKQKFDPRFMARVPNIELLFDIGGNLVSIGAREMEYFCEQYNEGSYSKMMVVEANLQVIELMLEEVNNVH